MYAFGGLGEVEVRFGRMSPWRDNQTRKDRATHGLWKAEMSKKTFRKYWENFFCNYALFYMQGGCIITEITVFALKMPILKFPAVGQGGVPEGIFYL